MSNVASIAGATPTLVSYNGNNVANGTVAFVDSVYASFIFDAASALTADAITIVQPTSGPGRWIRQQAANVSKWAQQAAWGVDTATGNDENIGSVASPLKTGAELGRRLYQAVLNQKTDITLVGNQAAGDILSLDVLIPTAGTLYIHGTATTFLTEGVGLTSVTAISRAAGGGNALTVIDTNLAGTWVALGLVNKRLRFTSGTANGELCWVAKDENAVNAKQARLSPAGATSVTTPPIAGTATLTTPAIGDKFVVETLCQWPRFRVRAENLTDALTVNSVALSVCVDSIDFVSPGRFVIEGTCQYQFVGCDNMNASQCGGAAMTMCMCRWLGGTLPATVTGGAVFTGLVACLCVGRTTAQDSGFLAISADTLAQGTIMCRARLGGVVRCGDCATFDSASDGFQVSDSGQMQEVVSVGGFGSTMYGKTNTGVGVNCQGRFTYLTGTRPTVTGTGGDFQIGAFVTSFPFDSGATLTFLPLLACSWANIAIAAGATGFGDHILDPRVPNAGIEGVAAIL